jgi:hypothetical protein
MRFLAADDCRTFFHRVGFDESGPIAGSRSATRFSKVFDCYYESGPALEPKLPRLVRALVAHQGEFAECVLWAAELVFGDRSWASPPRPDWVAYRQWRAAHHEPRRLFEAPGHVFDASERDLCATAVAWALRLGWDAFLASRERASVTALSHDDRITIYARTRPTALIVDLAKLSLDLRRREWVTVGEHRRKKVRHA